MTKFEGFLLLYGYCTICGMNTYKFKLMIDRVLIKVVNTFARRTQSEIRRSYYGHDPFIK